MHEIERSFTMPLLILSITWLVIWCHPVQCSVLMRQEECHNNGTKSGKCAQRVLAETLESIGASHQRSSVLDIEEPSEVLSPYRRFTPLPFAAFLQPRPVYQGLEERVFNVLEKEETVVPRLLKGGRRQVDRQVRVEQSNEGLVRNGKDGEEGESRNIEGTEVEESGLDAGEQTSNSNVKFRRRKGGKRSDRKKQLRRERIERKRARRKNRRKERREKKKNRNKHPKHRRGGGKRKVNKRKLKSLKLRNRNRSREEQIGVNPTVFIEEFNNGTEPAEFRLPEHQMTGPEVSEMEHDPSSGSEVFLEMPSSANDPSHGMNHIDVNNYQEAMLDDFDMGDEESISEDDDDYGEVPGDDYPMMPDYFNWKDNASIDYFTQGEDTTVSPESWPLDASGSPLHVDPSDIQIRRQVLRLHNLLRSKVQPTAANMLALSWHGEAAAQARRWAQSCAAHRGRNSPSERWTPRYGSCGQNVLVTRKQQRWAHVIRSWWGERRFFQFGSEDVRNSTYRARSYTQLVWYSSHRVGCGYAQCTTAGGSTFHRYVCNYCPAGNDPSRLSEPYTSGRPCEMCPTACRSVCPEGRCRLCTNRCPFSDLWANCAVMAQRWREWLCNTKTQQGVLRFKNCRATCQCALMGDKIV